MMLEPFGDRVVVEPIEAEQVSAGGVFLPDVAREVPQRGTVRAVGPGVWNGMELRPLLVSVGDEVLYSKYGGVDLEIDGEQLLVLRESDILGRICSST